MNQLYFMIALPKTNNSHRVNGKILVEYLHQGELRRIPVSIKKINHDILLEHANTKVRVYTVPALALRPCFPNNEFYPDDCPIGVIETLSAENAIMDTLLQEIGLRIATELRLTGAFIHKTKFGWADGVLEFQGEFQLNRSLKRLLKMEEIEHNEQTKRVA